LGGGGGGGGGESYCWLILVEYINCYVCDVQKKYITLIFCTLNVYNILYSDGVSKCLQTPFHSVCHQTDPNCQY